MASAQKQRLDTIEVLSLMPVIRDVLSVVYLYKTKRMLGVRHQPPVTLIH